MFISKWQPPLAAILKIYIFKSKNPIFMKFASKCVVFQIFLDKIQLYFCVLFPLTVFSMDFPLEIVSHFFVLNSSEFLYAFLAMHSL